MRDTQRAIRATLRERWYAWEDARRLFDSGYRPMEGEAEDDWEDDWEEEDTVQTGDVKEDTAQDDKKRL